MTLIDHNLLGRTRELDDLNDLIRILCADGSTLHLDDVDQHYVGQLAVATLRASEMTQACGVATGRLRDTLTFGSPSPFRYPLWKQWYVEFEQAFMSLRSE